MVKRTRVATRAVAQLKQNVFYFVVAFDAAFAVAPVAAVVATAIDAVVAFSSSSSFLVPPSLHHFAALISKLQPVVLRLGSMIAALSVEQGKKQLEHVLFQFDSALAVRSGHYHSHIVVDDDDNHHDDYQYYFHPKKNNDDADDDAHAKSQAH